MKKKKKENTLLKKKKEKKIKRNEESLWEIWGSMKRENIQVIGIQERLENAKEIKSIFKKIITENFPNLQKIYNYPSIDYPSIKDHLSDSTQPSLPQDIL